jgi:hypothetical protein
VNRVYDWPEFRPRALLEHLVAAQVDFVVIGGLARILHGGATITRDLDITYASSRENVEHLGTALVALDARVRGVTEGLPFAPDGQELTRVRLDTRDGRLDLVAEPQGAPRYERLRERAVVMDVGGIEVRVASLDDLIAMKKAAGRPKDLVAVEELEAIKRLRRTMT